MILTLTILYNYRSNYLIFVGMKVNILSLNNKNLVHFVISWINVVLLLNEVKLIWNDI